MKRVTRLIVLLSVPVLIAVGLHWHSSPVKAADNGAESAAPAGLEAKGRDVQVIDGDTIMIAGKVVDIAGMDAPELGQQCLHNGSFWDCGMSSAMQLRKYFAMAPFNVHCWPGDRERAGKADDFPIMECGIGERDVAAAMISDGEALPITGYSHRYDRLSRDADSAGIGIHGGKMISPADWRAGKRLDGETGRCLFVADGKGHYLSTLDPRFTKTASETKICSDEEARSMNLDYLPPSP